MARKLRIMTWNILADIWLNEADYSQVASLLLDKHHRHQQHLKIIDTINADIILLQEVELSVATKLKTHYSTKYVTMSLYSNEEKLWRIDLAPNKVLEPTGNLIMMRRRLFKNVSSASLKLSKDGDTASLVKFSYRGSNYLIANVHLDPRKQTRINEATRLLDFLKKQGNNNIIVAGDFNSDDLGPLFAKYSFHNTKTKDDLCKPTYYCQTAIDQIYSNNAKNNDSFVFDSLLPRVTTKKGCKFNMMKLYGSDHLPLILDRII